MERCKSDASAFPNSRGVALDQHERPSALEPRIDWIQIDLNLENFSQSIDRRVDVTYATAVWEHVSRPDAFVSNLLRVTKNPGFVPHLPDYSSLARRVLGTRWPYFLPVSISPYLQDMEPGCAWSAPGHRLRGRARSRSRAAASSCPIRFPTPRRGSACPFWRAGCPTAGVFAAGRRIGSRRVADAGNNRAAQ